MARRWQSSDERASGGRQEVRVFKNRRAEEPGMAFWRQSAGCAADSTVQTRPGQAAWRLETLPEMGHWQTSNIRFDVLAIDSRTRHLCSGADIVGCRRWRPC